MSDISREAVTAVAEFWWGKGYPKIADMLWELRDALDAAEAELTAALYAIGETEGDLRAAIAAEGSPAIQDAWGAVEEHIDYAYRAMPAAGETDSKEGA